MNSYKSNANKAVATWLFIGAAMIIVQILLGGITRLTGSGLSITEWKPILGALPPLSDKAWQDAFEKYQQIGQYKYLNAHFTLSDFKSIYFWEWFHRLWARLLGVVFIAGFIYLYIKRYFRKEMIIPMVILFLLGGLQGAIGWIMVESGLNDESLYVNHIKLAIHFIAALGLLVYTFWFGLQLLLPTPQGKQFSLSKKLLLFIIGLLVLQFIYGAFMAGLKAATTATTWPTINGQWIPGNFSQYGNRSFSFSQAITGHPLMVQFIHRTIAYILTLLIAIWYMLSRKTTGIAYFNNTRWLPLALVCCQVILGIATVLNASSHTALLWLGVGHQFVAILLFMSCTWLLYVLPENKQQAETKAIRMKWVL